MSETTQHALSHDKFLNLSANLLAKAFFDNTRTVAKRCFTELSAGQKVGLSRVTLEDESTVDVYLTMDCSEYCGRISYSHFREQLQLLLQRFSKAIEANEDLEVLDDQNGRLSIFKMPVLHAVNDQVNALVLGWWPSVAGQLELRLMYLDPEQFRIDSEQGE